MEKRTGRCVRSEEFPNSKISLVREKFTHRKCVNAFLCGSDLKKCIIHELFTNYLLTIYLLKLGQLLVNFLS